MNKKELTDYKIMTIKLLIKAAKSVIEEFGIDNLTIRKVGDKAGYNSATIYNYFENIEHLKIFVFLFDYDEYIRDLENYVRSEEHTSELQSRQYLVCRLLLEKKKTHI